MPLALTRHERRTVLPKACGEIRRNGSCAVCAHRFAQLTVRFVADACGAVDLFNAIAGIRSDAF
jgi:hypothetical protein